MKNLSYSKLITFALTGASLFLTSTATVRADSTAEIDRQARAALRQLYANSAGARHLGHSARAVLIFPEITKAGLIIGAQAGKGALIDNNRRTVGYYRTVAASYGLQAGAQKFGYALFFMTDRDLAYLRKSGGWEIGANPNITIIDTGMLKSLSTTTLRKGVYGFAFNQRGLMAGLTLQGSKIIRLRGD